MTIFEQTPVQESNLGVLMKMSNAREMDKTTQNQKMSFSLLLIESTVSVSETCLYLSLVRANRMLRTHSNPYMFNSEMPVGKCIK